MAGDDLASNFPAFFTLDSAGALCQKSMLRCAPTARRYFRLKIGAANVLLLEKRTNFKVGLKNPLKILVFRDFSNNLFWRFFTLGRWFELF